MLALGWALGAAISTSALYAEGHMASLYYKSGKFWPVNHTEGYWIRDNFPSSSYGSRINEARAHWNSVGGMNEVDFVYNGVTTATGNFNEPCSPNVSISMVSMRSDLPAGVGGRANSCNDPALGYRTKFHIGINPNFNWYVGTGLPSSSQVDLRSVATHEFGHTTGFTGHFLEGSSTCNGEFEPHHTMCPAISPGESFMRSTAEHDQHTFLAAY